MTGGSLSPSNHQPDVTIRELSPPKEIVDTYVQIAAVEKNNLEISATTQGSVHEGKLATQQVGGFRNFKN